MISLPKWFKPFAQAVAFVVALVLLAGLLAVPLRSLQPTEGYTQPRVHWNTKNTTRFKGADLAGVAALVSQAVYPAAGAGESPSVVFLYSPDDWQSGLLAASLLRPVRGVLLPLTPGVETEVERLNPSGSPALDGARLITLGSASAPAALNGFKSQALDAVGILAARQQIGDAPQHVLIVDRSEPATALLAAPWAAYSGDLVVFDLADAPAGLPRYSLGKASAPGATAISGASPAQVAVRFAQYTNDSGPLFGWGMNAGTTTGYRAYTLARLDDPATALLSANLAVRGKPGPLLPAGEQSLPQVVQNYLWSQRAAFWITPSDGPFHHFWILGGVQQVAFPAQSQADYAVEIGPYLGKSVGMSGIDMLAAGWVMLGLASAAWVLFHEVKFLPLQNWILRLAWPLLALIAGPFGIPLYALAYNRPIIRHEKMTMWDRPLWLQGLAAATSAVGFGAPIMVASGYLLSLFGLPLIPGRGALFFLGSPMILIMVMNYFMAVLVAWPVFQAPMLAMFDGIGYKSALRRSLPLVLISMAVAALAMNPTMWWLMMSHLPMMPNQRSILWFGIMFFSGFMAFLLAWPANYLMVRRQRKGGLM